MGASNLTPGPNSTELAIHIGRVRAGWRGPLAGPAGGRDVLHRAGVPDSPCRRAPLRPLRVYPAGAGPMALVDISGNFQGDQPCP
jgi:hypothetical protein